jgi:CBS domain-containing protein
MTLVLKLLQEKGHDVWSIRPDETVYDAIRLMAEKNIGALAVIEGDRVVGIITERHYARNVVLLGRSSPATPVRDVMESRVVYVRPERTVEECMAVMTEQRIRHLLVMDNGSLAGIISIGDLVKSIISHQKFIIDELIHFIAGNR